MKQKSIWLLCLLFLYNPNIFSQIVNVDTLFINNNTLVYFGEEYTNNGLHSSHGDLYLNDNFINNDSTSASAGTTFFRSSVNDIQSISGASNWIKFFNLEIDNSLTGVTVTNDFGLLVENAVHFSAGDLRLIGDAQLIQTHTGNSVNTTVSGNLLRDQQGNFSAFAYNYWASPVNNSGSFSIVNTIYDGTDASLNPFNPQAVNYNSGAPYHGQPSIVDVDGNVLTALTLNKSWFYKYSRGNGSIAEWIKIDENASLLPGEGYAMKGTNTSAANQNYVFKGQPNDGDYEFAISNTEYLLIGNPYPSALDAEEFIKDHVSIAEGGNALTDIIDGALYFWVDGGSSSHSYSGYYGGYATRNLTGGVAASLIPSLDTIAGAGSSGSTEAPKRFMGVGQGFFIYAIGDGTIEFKNSQRAFKTESSGESLQYKKSGQIEKRSMIRIGYEDPEGFHRQLVLGFIPNSPADLGFNRAYDAPMFGSRLDDLYFVIENDPVKRYVIQGVGDFDENIKIPFGLSINEAGQHSIMLDNLENILTEVYLEDRVLNMTYNLSEQNFEFDLPQGVYLDRFYLVFKPKATLDVDQFDEADLRVYDSGENSFIIDNIAGLELNQIRIFNVLGQLMLHVNHKALEQNKITLPFNNIPGVYLINIQSDKGEKTYKILKR